MRKQKMNKQIEEMAQVYEEARSIAQETLGSMNEGAGVWYAKAFYNAGYRRQDEVAREIFEELSATIMPLVESHNKIAENTGDILWGHKADGLETALLALKGIIRKYGVIE